MRCAACFDCDEIHDKLKKWGSASKCAHTATAHIRERVSDERVNNRVCNAHPPPSLVTSKVRRCQAKKKNVVAASGEASYDERKKKFNQTKHVRVSVGV